MTCPVEYVWLSHPLSTRQIKDNSLEDAKTSEDDRLYSISLVSGRFCGKDMGVEYSRLFNQTSGRGPDGTVTRKWALKAGGSDPSL